MIQASYSKYILQFKRPSGTSRGVMTTKETWFIVLKQHGKIGIGECGILRGLSVDDRPDYEQKLQWTCANIHLGLDELLAELVEFPSIQFGLETAFKSLKADHPFVLFPSDFTQAKASIPINGLVWMGDKAFMSDQIAEKLETGFNCVKLKIGAIDFASEIALIEHIRSKYDKDQIEIRVDANGAFAPNEALDKLDILSQYDLHSVEQPVKAGQYSVMADLCQKTKLPIALDEELIGVFSQEDKNRLLSVIKPQYIILKPSLIGGFSGSKQWIDLANLHGIGWWITSALESNIGLNAIAQFTYQLNNPMPQGLGTGGLYTNNFESPLKVTCGKLHYQGDFQWNLNQILQQVCG